MNPLAGSRRAAAPPADIQYLWYLGDPRQPRLIGTLQLVMNGRGVSLRYDAGWLAHGFALSEDLPLIDSEHFPPAKDSAAGAVDDARPDRWGERVIRAIDRPARLSLLEYLLHAGDDRFGALSVSTSAAAYLPRAVGPLPQLADVESIQRVVRQILAGEAVDERLRRLIAPGVSLGGARPKGLLHMRGHEWVVKFAESDRPAEPLIEHATLTLAAKAGITVAETKALALANGHALAIRRFDRSADGLRRHALSAHVALRAADVELSYPNLALLLRRRGQVAGQANRQQMHELFRRLVFNILIDNSDDHEKNHVLLLADDGCLHLAPAFDVLPIGQSLGYQAMVVGDEGAVAHIDNALSAAAAYWLTRDQAVAEARAVAAVVKGWRRHFAARKLAPAVLDELAHHIDRPDLLAQRRALSTPG